MTSATKTKFQLAAGGAVAGAAIGALSGKGRRRGRRAAWGAAIGAVALPAIFITAVLVWFGRSGG